MLTVNVIIHLYAFCFLQIDKIMSSIDVGINSELEEMNGEATSKEISPVCYKWINVHRT